MIPADLFMGLIYLQCRLCFYLISFYLVQSIKKIKLQRLNNIADKSKNLLSLHNSPRPLKIWHNFYWSSALSSALSITCCAAKQQKHNKFQRVQTFIWMSKRLHKNHMVIGYFSLEETLKSHLLQPPVTHLKGRSLMRSDQASQGFIHQILKTSNGKMSLHNL